VRSFPARGWEAVAEWTDGVAPDSIDVLRGVCELEFVYPSSTQSLAAPSGSFARAAALEALVAAGGRASRPRTSAKRCTWLSDDAREATIRALRQAHAVASQQRMLRKQ